MLTGAGLSTDSGIPDYRGPGAPVRMPMTYQEFVSGPASQQRYWGRAHVGWSRMRRAEPNDGHRALARLEALGRVGLLVTQNVDGLHERAGSRAVVALHGRISDVVCIDCRRVTGRAKVQEQMGDLNPGWVRRHGEVLSRPDGDVALEETAGFVVPSATPAAVDSSPTWSSSARTSPRTASPVCTPPSTPPTRCWWPGRRWP